VDERPISFEPDMRWRSATWQPLDAALFCPVAVASAEQRIVLFARRGNGELVYHRWQDGGWAGLRSLGVPLARSRAGSASIAVDWQLAGCSSAEGLVDLFGKSPDGEIVYFRFAETKSAVFECLGAPADHRWGIAVPLGVAASPAVCSGANGTLDLFVVGYDGELLHASHRDGIWTGFVPLGMTACGETGTKTRMPLGGPLAACSCGYGRFAVFTRGAAGDLLIKWRDGESWTDFASLGSYEVPDPNYPVVNLTTPLTGPPAACSWGPRRLDVFVRGAAGQMLHRQWEGKEWSDFHSLGMPLGADRAPLPFTGTIAACSWGPKRLDVFARAVDGRLYHAWFDGRWEHGDQQLEKEVGTI
jgi:hypothetical protein